MTPRINKRIVLKRRPSGVPSVDDFEIRAVPLPDIGPGEVLRRTIYISLDPYVRRLLSPEESGWTPMPIDEVIVGGTVSQIVESRNSEFAEGEFVLGGDGWQEYAVSNGHGLSKIDPELKQKSLMLGALGMPGEVAYGALLGIGRPKAGETVVISAAAGAIGSVAGQIAKLKGCRVVGIAGSAEKCRIVTEIIGFDACINHRSEDVSSALAKVCPDGVDVYFDNVAGRVLEAVLENLNSGARIALVGLISQYNAAARPAGPNLVQLLHKGALIQGYGGDHSEHLVDFQADMSDWIRSGKIVALEHVVTGLRNAPRAFIGLFTGENVGKALVHLPENWE